MNQSNYQDEIKALLEAEFLKVLGQKLIEESQKVALALDKRQDELITELAILYEVIDALIESSGLNREQILAKQQEIQEQRGRFEKEIKLGWLEPD